MKQKSTQTERIHSLDALRAMMLLLGLVFHSALTYTVTSRGAAWPIKDTQSTSLFCDYIMLVIHAFRMPVFFLVAGFFGAMLFYERGAIEMIKNRMSRIVYPFIVFLFLVYPVIIFSFGYSKAVFSSNENPLFSALEPLLTGTAFLPKATVHLWFLYYLIIITAAVLLSALILRQAKKLTGWTTRQFNFVIQRPVIRVLFFSALTFLQLTILGVSMINASVSFIPELKTFIFFLLFYLAGWMLFRSKHLLKSMVRYDWICTLLGIITVSIQGLLIKYLKADANSDAWILIFVSSISVWLFSFGIMGLFIRYGSEFSAKIRYISDASYWVYLIHLPLPAIIPAFIFEFPFPSLVKFLINLSLTTFICFASYHYLVRNSFIGKFLNGRKIHQLHVISGKN